MQTCANWFEGPEKKLEVILARPVKGLRENPGNRWASVVRASQAEIISQLGNDRVDAYLLSESSLFVWDDRILMITCGRTTLVNAVPEIIGIVGRENISLVFYERKNPMYPDHQKTDFRTDVQRLVRYFPGKSYRLGPENDDHVNVFYSSHADVVPGKDATFQLLMNELDPATLDLFSDEKAGTAIQAAALSRLTDLYPSMKVDSYFFSPCGYSLNGINGGFYYTVHITPQPMSSYASFETNVIQQDYMRVVKEITAIVRPNRFSVVLTASMDRSCASLRKAVSGTLSGYDVTESSSYELDCGYTTTFLNHQKSIQER